MRFPASTLSSKGQTTVPKSIRDRLGLRPGDRVHFVSLPDGTIRLVAQNLPITALDGMLPRPQRPATIAEMNDAIARGASQGLVREAGRKIRRAK